MNKISTWIALLIGLTTLVGTMFALDNRYAKTEDISDIESYVEQIDQRLELKILKDRANAVQERMWKIEDRYGMEVAKMSEEVRDQYRELKKEYDEIMHCIIFLITGQEVSGSLLTRKDMSLLMMSNYPVVRSLLFEIRECQHLLLTGYYLLLRC